MMLRQNIQHLGLGATVCVSGLISVLAKKVSCTSLLLLLVFVAASLIFGFDWRQGDHLSGKPGNVREFESETCQGNVRDNVNSQGNVREKILSGKSVPKLFITR